MNNPNELVEFIAWLHDTQMEIRKLMAAIRIEWKETDDAEIMHVVSHDHVRTMYDTSYTPYAAAVWVTDCSPVAHHFVDCEARKRREHLAKRRSRFTNNRRSWRRG